MERYGGIDEIALYIKQIKQRIETLENENLVLKAQLSQAHRDLVELRRITILIDGHPITPATMPDVLPPPVATIHTIATLPGAAPPGLFSSSPPLAASAAPGGLFAQPTSLAREPRPTRPDTKEGNDFLY